MKHILLILSAFLLTCCISDCKVNAQIFKTSSNMNQKMYITIGGRTETVTLVNNLATQELMAKLQEKPLTVILNSSGGFEIWGALGFSLPTSNEQTNAQPGDVVLYNGCNICFFYGTNTWSYTRLGKIDGLSENELHTFLKAGENNICVTLSLSNSTDINQVKTDDTNTREYTLQGILSQNGTKGITIKNHKKTAR